MPDDMTMRDAAGSPTKIRSYWTGTAHVMKRISVAHFDGGASAYRNLDVDETGVIVKNAPGQLYGFRVTNLHATDKRYLKFYSKATAATAADTPVMTIPVSAGQTEREAFPVGVVFAAGISIRATTALADNDVGAPGANEVVVNLLYA
jgi:hypothetical protein